MDTTRYLEAATDHDTLSLNLPPPSESSPSTFFKPQPCCPYPSPFFNT